MSRTAIKLAAFLCLVAGALAFVTAASTGRREEARMDSAGVEVMQEPDLPTKTAEWLSEYTLTERSGREFHSQELDGQVHVVSFFFAACPTVCRLQNGKVQELARVFGPRGVVFLSITCDPVNDTPASLKNYAKQFEADEEQWLFLTSSDLNYLRRVGAEVYAVPVDQQVHSERLLVVDREGEIRGQYHWNNPAEIKEMTELLDGLLAQ